MNYSQVLLQNGLQVTIRPIRSTDIHELFALHQRSSVESLYYRYLRTFTPSYEDIKDLCHTHPSEGTILVAVAKMPWEMVIGFAYYLFENDVAGKVTAEPAFHVDDRFQGLGLGTHLFRCLSETAVYDGVELFTAYVHPGNEAMHAIFTNSGYNYSSELAYGTREFAIDLATTSRAAKRPLPVAV